MVSIDYTVIIQIINFIVLIFVLNAVLYKPIRSILLKRRETIGGLESRIDTLTTDTEEKNQAFSAGLRSARSNGLKEKEAILQAAAEEEKKIVGKIMQKAQADLVDVKKKIAADTEGVRKKLLSQIDEYANTIGEKILGRTIS